MAFEKKDMTGSIFPARKDNEKQPDKNGSVMIEGKMYYLSVWSRVSQSGSTYESIAVKTQAEYDKYKKPTQENTTASNEVKYETQHHAAPQQAQQPVEEKKPDYDWNKPVDTGGLPF